MQFIGESYTIFDYFQKLKSFSILKSLNFSLYFKIHNTIKSKLINETINGDLQDKIT